MARSTSTSFAAPYFSAIGQQFNHLMTLFATLTKSMQQRLYQVLLAHRG